MTNEFINFEKISREAWKMLHQKTKPLLTQEELESITSLNDNISITDVIDIYLPLINLIQIYKIAQENLSFSKSLFLLDLRCQINRVATPNTGKNIISFMFVCM